MKDLSPADVRPRELRPVESPVKPAEMPAPAATTSAAAGPTEFPAKPVLPSRPTLSSFERPAPKAAAPKAAEPVAASEPAPERPTPRPAPRVPVSAAVSPREPAQIAKPTPPAEPRPAAEPAATERRAPKAGEWGLAAAPRRPSFIGRVAPVALALACVGGAGYYGYNRFMNQAPVVAETDEPEADDSKTETAANSSAGTEVAGEADDPFGELPPPTVTSKRKSSPPRIASHSAKAIPIQAVEDSTGEELASTASAESADDDIDLLLDLPGEGENSEPADRQLGDEPGEELEPGSEPPMLRVPQPVPARRSKTTASRAAGMNNAPALLAPQDDVDGYIVAEDQAAAEKADRSGGPKISIVEAQDEADQLEDFEAEDLEKRRAISKTVVVHPKETSAAAASSDADLNDGWTVDESRPISRKAARVTGDSAPTTGAATGTGIAARSKSAGAMEAFGDPSRRTARDTEGFASELHPAGTPSRNVPQRGETYTVTPNDNFWTISRKQYGTSRYFSALAKHNAERIPDPQRLRPGMQVSTPAPQVLEELYPQLIDKSGAAAAPAMPREDLSDGRPAFQRPAAVSAAAEPERSAPTAPTGYFLSKSGEPLYRIGSDDTLSSIAQKHLGRASRWTEIFEQNRGILNNPENLTVGTVIRLPPDASRIGSGREGAPRR